MSYANYQSRALPDFVRYIADLMRYRHLCWNLVGSDLRARFRRSKLGILWAVIQPLGYSLIIAWAWGVIFKVSNYWAFATYVYSGMLVWDFFSNTVMGGLDGLIGATGYLRQARIPLLVFQTRVPLSGGVNFLFGMIGLGVMMTALQLWSAPGPHLLLVPASLLFLLLFLLPLTIVLSILGTQFRDLKHIMGLALQALFFLSPVMIQREFLNSKELAVLKYVNPLVPLIDLFRAPLLQGDYWRTDAIITICIWISVMWTLAIILSTNIGRRVVFSL